MELSRFIEAAAGRKEADCLFFNGKILNVFTGQWEEGPLAVADGRILGQGDYKAVRKVDLKGRYLVPGFVDAHVHIESSLLSPEQFAALVVPRGTTTVIADPHEIANVSGLDGIRYMLEASENLPLDCLFMLPSCVPATPFEKAGAELGAEELAELIDHPRVLGLGEMMNYPGLIGADPEVLKKLTLALDRKKPMDGHSPGVSGLDLNAYAGAGIGTDHECSTSEEMLDRIGRGMYVLIREGSAARNLADLVPCLKGTASRYAAFCTDDKQPEDILADGHIDFNIRKAVSLGMDPVQALQTATIQACLCYGLEGKGALAPGYTADMVVLEDLESFKVKEVYRRGESVVKGGALLRKPESIKGDAVRNSVKLDPLKPEDLALKLKSNKVRVIAIQPHSILTEMDTVEVIRDSSGYYINQPDQDLLKMAVVERHGKGGGIGLGLVSRYGLKGGAVASTIAHDSHNLIVIGDNDADMALAANILKEGGGGISVVHQGKLAGKLTLPIAGLMSDRGALEVNETLGDLLKTARKTLGIKEDLDPFMTLAFLALPVIPELKLTDQGLFDVTSFNFVEICL